MKNVERGRLRSYPRFAVSTALVLRVDTTYLCAKKDSMRFFNIFRRKSQKSVRSLRIDGVSTKMTPRPDDAELAAQALLEHMSEKKKKNQSHKSKQPKEGTPAYYKQLNAKICAAHAIEARDTQRYLAYTEEELKENPSYEQLQEIERGLYKLQYTVEREGGELKSRWQHCIAECILLQQTEPDNDTTEK